MFSFRKNITDSYRRLKRFFTQGGSDDTLSIKEYINGLTGSEYYAKVTANRFKTTIRYGRREVSSSLRNFFPDSIMRVASFQYGIMTDADWKVDLPHLSEQHCTSNPTRFFYKSDSYHKSRGFYRGSHSCFSVQLFDIAGVLN